MDCVIPRLLSAPANFPCPPLPVSGITLYMIRQVRFDKKQRVVDELVRRIESGLMEDGFLLPGEHQLAQEFNVSRGTLREALAELKAAQLHRHAKRGRLDRHV